MAFHAITKNCLIKYKWELINFFSYHALTIYRHKSFFLPLQLLRVLDYDFYDEKLMVIKMDCFLLYIWKFCAIKSSLSRFSILLIIEKEESTLMTITKTIFCFYWWFIKSWFPPTFAWLIVLWEKGVVKL